MSGNVYASAFVRVIFPDLAMQPSAPPRRWPTTKDRASFAHREEASRQGSMPDAAASSIGPAASFRRVHQRIIDWSAKPRCQRLHELRIFNHIDIGELSQPGLGLGEEGLVIAMVDEVAIGNKGPARATTGSPNCRYGTRCLMRRGSLEGIFWTGAPCRPKDPKAPSLRRYMRAKRAKTKVAVIRAPSESSQIGRRDTSSKRSKMRSDLQ